MVVLPNEFRFQESEIFIRRNSETGDLVLSSIAFLWQEFFDLADRTNIPEDFMVYRNFLSAERENLF